MANLPENSLTREEVFLRAAATGDTSNLPEPITRVEEYLKYIAENGGGGGGGTSDYNALSNKPSIGGQTLQGDMSLEDISGITDEDVAKLEQLNVPVVSGETLSI